MGSSDLFLHFSITYQDLHSSNFHFFDFYSIVSFYSYADYKYDFFYEIMIENYKLPVSFVHGLKIFHEDC